MIKNKKFHLYFLGILILLLISTFNSTPSKAYTYNKGSSVTIDKIVQKNTTTAVQIFKATIKISDLVDHSDKLQEIVSDNKKCTVPMPNTIIPGSKNSSPTLTCYEFLFGKGNDWSGILQKPNFNDFTTAPEYGNYLAKLGYKKQQESSKNTKEHCLYAIETRELGESKNQVCVNEIIGKDKDGEYAFLDINSFRFDKPQYVTDTIFFDGDYGNHKKKISLKRNTEELFHVTVNNDDLISWNDYYKMWEDAHKEAQCESVGDKDCILRTTIIELKEGTKPGTSDSSGETITKNSVYKKGSDSTISKSLLGVKDYYAKPLTTAEVYNIYNQYLNSKNVNIKCDESFDFEKDPLYSWMHVQVKRNGKIDNTCWVREVNEVKYTGAEPNAGNSKTQFWFTRRNMSLKDIVDQINGFDLKSIINDINDIDNASLDDSDPDSGTTDGDSDPCYDAGVEGMSWVLCPALNNTATTVDAIEGVLRDWLQIKSGEMFNDGVYEGWKIFRNIANVILIIIFLAIIFSQLTGYGIDNYGIKKMLPKLIIMAILINLSYIICQLAVDLSNILGVGLDNIMKTVGFTINGGSDPNQGFGVHHIAVILLGAFAAGGTVAGIAISSGGGIMLVVSLLLAALVALVAVLMFFVMLGARMVIVSVFVVLSPVAFVFYILPNTQSLFKKWWKVFEAALVVFPICGALYGASYIAKAIIGPNPSNFFLGMIGVIVPFLPFLVLPSLLKGALAGLGAIGGTLTALGGSLKKGAQSGSNAIQSGIKGTERYKNNMQERARSRQAKLTNRGIEKLENRQKKLAGKGKSLSAGEQQLLARRYQTKDKLENEDRAARVIVEQNRTRGMDLNGLMQEWEAAWGEGDKDGGKKLDAMTSVISSRYGAAGANRIANSLAGKDIVGDEKAQSMMSTLQNNMNHDSTFANNMRSKASDAYGMISDGGKDKNGNYQNLSHFSKKENQIATSYKDWSTQSSDTLKRAIDSEALKKEQVRELLNSTDPSIQSGLQSDEGKRNVLQAAMSGATNLSSMDKEQIEDAAKTYRSSQTTPVLPPTQITSGDARTDEAELNVLKQKRRSESSGDDKISPGGVILS